jgi:hypothetical protein
MSLGELLKQFLSVSTPPAAEQADAGTTQRKRQSQEKVEQREQKKSGARQSQKQQAEEKEAKAEAIQ